MKIEYQVKFEEFSSAASAAQKSSKVRRRQFRVVFIWYALIVAAVIILLTMIDRLTPSQATQSAPVKRNIKDVLVPLLPWGVVVLGILILARFLRRNVYRRSFDSQPVVHRPTVLETIEGGLVFTTSVSRHEWKWDGFTKLQETSNAFVIFISDLSMNIVPKRAFESESQMTEFRELLRANISPPPMGFAVQLKSEP